MEYTEEAQRVAVDMTPKMARPLKAKYALATLGSKTAQGGEVVTAFSKYMVEGHPVACVGDTVRYPDDSEAKIVSGAGSALRFSGQPAALVGSAIDNGDRIISSLQSAAEIREYLEDPIPGLFQVGYSIHGAMPSWSE